ncbi:MAG: hypothetical protein Q8K85_23910 [Hyphomicrobium sp.]|nr:hypothetical protein [Hyphomicrobium sp.]
MRRTTFAFVAVAAFAAAAALAVWAAGFALFAFTEPLIGAPAAAGVVSAIAAVSVALFAWHSAGKAEEKSAQVEVVQSVASPLTAVAPLELVAAAFRERPLVSLGLTVLAGVVASRQPHLVREVAGALTDRR